MRYNGPGYAPVRDFDLRQNPPGLKLAKASEVSNPGEASMEHSHCCAYVAFYWFSFDIYSNAAIGSRIICYAASSPLEVI